MQVPPPGFDFGDGGPLWGQENQGGGGRARIQIVRRGGGGVGGAQPQAQARVGIADSPLAAILQALGWNGGAQNQAGDALDPDEVPLFGGNQNPRGGNQRGGDGPSRGPATGIGRAEGGANPIPLRNLARYVLASCSLSLDSPLSIQVGIWELIFDWTPPSQRQLPWRIVRPSCTTTTPRCRPSKQQPFRRGVPTRSAPCPARPVRVRGGRRSASTCAGVGP